MKKLRGVKLGRKLVRIFRWLTRPDNKPTRFLSIACPLKSKILALARNLKRVVSLPDSKPGGCVQLGKVTPAPAVVPKGHLAVYVGESNGDIRRELVPVIYFNHPLFGELLKDAERVYGYNHSGGIKIPVGYSEFEKVKMRIAARNNYLRCSSY
ncbi:SAUR-like auxin-responsive protein family [Euphorbia peplus]|nr:SAUR-like auxin-responsive protein family [Euphorbia peplus]